MGSIYYQVWLFEIALVYGKLVIQTEYDQNKLLPPLPLFYGFSERKKPTLAAKPQKFLYDDQKRHHLKLASGGKGMLNKGSRLTTFQN